MLTFPRVAPTWASVEYDGRWKVLHYAAKKAYEHVIIAPYFDRATGNLSVWVSSDLWSPAQGKATFTWYDWKGTKLDIGTNTTSVDVSIGAINSTQVLQTFTTCLLAQYDPNDVLLRMEVEVESQLPSSNETQTFKNDNWFHPAALRTAKLVDPGLELSYDESSKNFSVTATKGVAAWVWLDYPAGAVLHFDSNGFWLAANETREVGYTVKSDTTGGKWIQGVTVGSMWNLTLAE